MYSDVPTVSNLLSGQVSWQLPHGNMLWEMPNAAIQQLKAQNPKLKIVVNIVNEGIVLNTLGHVMIDIR